jgi:creatinine amidohydrolase
MGMRNFILFTGHASGKQIAAMQEASEKFIDSNDNSNVAVVCDYDITRHADFIDTPGDIHAGEIETSRIMAIEPSLVLTDKFPPPEKRQFPSPILVRDQKRYWPGTVEGDPTTASAEKGKKLCQMVARYLADLVKKMESFQPH